MLRGGATMRTPSWLRSSVLLLALGAVVGGCAPGAPTSDDDEEVSSGDEKAFTSAQATLLTFEIDGELSAPWQSGTTKLIKSQLFYTVGPLNAHDSVARLDRVVLSNVKRISTNDGWMRVTYHASLPVGWGSKTDIPKEMTFTLPRKIGPQSLKSFTTKYAASCVEEGGHDVTSDNFWYHYRTEASGCTFEPADVATAHATVTVAPSNTSAKYPEYDRVWSDGKLEVVAVFGKYEDYATDPSDAGIETYNAFVEKIRAGLGAGFTTVPASVPQNPGTAATDVTFTGAVDGRTVRVTALLIDSPKVATAAFDARFYELTKTADIISYNGHAGLGANVRALANKGQIVKGQYRIFFLNGCDTFAYLDDTLAKRVAAKNTDDPKGTKYLDLLANLKPAYFSSMPDASYAVVEALAHPEDPETYEQIFAKVDRSQVVMATGEEDNTYVPPAASFDGLEIANVLAPGQSHSFETPMLPAGRYVVKTSENGAGGDVDLYVGVGYAPTHELYDERPYLYGSNEEVTVELEAPAKIYVMVDGYAGSESAANAYRLSIR